MSDVQQTAGAIAFVGFGEAARAFVSGWGPGAPAGLRAFDVKMRDPAAREAMLEACAAHGVHGEAEVRGALEGAPAVFCLVTADRALEAAEACEGLAPGALWLDGNSCAPETKRQAEEVIAAKGGRYVDVAIMAPVHPKKHRVPLLLSGPHAEAAAEVLSALGMSPRVAGEEVGAASTIKMLRSVMIKGMEALSAECLLAARRAGVDDAVLGSLAASNPEVDWEGRGTYHLGRMIEHGERRAAEMREVVRTVEGLGLPADMARAVVLWQARVAGAGAELGEEAFGPRADRLLDRL
ncbi:DUF1932 domain-containing protein [Allosediminivita pacifica]|uniref:3-hydroxyisobutyrate dehydrogenase-like beta-hydroxyacid dehydrogenase n=1 Tax=Allosediminivita pacifica TaxID=1267769 RepID=A0A2T6AUF5_9RHOB|nr:DUF1932 domain-containing protein [Allosediminivita pacifica]PTX47452.1 3-hydroxyisobutyrate dehydrogenase-like beta-hydroxyacid dehydrogenase [Allosediminivita pacifica]GGB14321.1 6-phosphogluconate dehydrogenase [Allosediminivita pacifica]